MSMGMTVTNSISKSINSFLRVAEKFPNIRTGFLCYSITFLLVLVAFGLRLAIAPVDAGLQFVTLFPTVTLAALIGGYRAGLLGTLLGVIVANYCFMPPYFSFSDIASKLSLWGNLVFVVDGVILSFSIELMHQFRRHNERQLEESRETAMQLLTLNQKLNQTISNFNETQQALRHFEAIIESSDDAIISKTLDGVIQSWNRGAEVIFGYQASEVVGKPMAMLFPPDRQNEEQELLSRIARGEKVEHFETVRQCKDGRLIDISATLSPIWNLEGSIIGVSKIARNITPRKQLEEEIRQLAFYDPLTALPNRRLLFDRLNQVLAGSKRNGQYGALLFLDLNKFKLLNDTHGHDAGDLLLIEVATRLKSSVRETDTVARLGGDEFVVLLSELDRDKDQATAETLRIGEKIRVSLTETYRLTIQHTEGSNTFIEHNCTTSIGGVLFQGYEETAEALLKKADNAMYQAKQERLDSLHFFNRKKPIPVAQDTFSLVTTRNNLLKSSHLMSNSD
jgi:diguanylate cyclase (GGDEF)-like protein/PAS domain S-box-containing protein